MADISEYSIVTYERKPGHWRAAITRKARAAGAVLGQDRVHAAGPAGRKAMASISIFAFSNRPATCTAVLVDVLMLTTWFMPAPSLPSESRMRSNVVRTSCSNVTLPLSGDNGTPTWPAMKIQEPAVVSMGSSRRNLVAEGVFPLHA